MKINYSIICLIFQKLTPAILANICFLNKDAWWLKTYLIWFMYLFEFILFIYLRIFASVNFKISVPNWMVTFFSSSFFCFINRTHALSSYIRLSLPSMNKSFLSILFKIDYSLNAAMCLAYDISYHIYV